MVVWTPAPWKVGVAPWREQASTYRAWKKKPKVKKPEQTQKYHVCPSCPKWCYQDKLKQQGGMCLCGATIDHKLHHRSWAGWGTGTGTGEQMDKVAQAMAIVVGSLDTGSQAAFLLEYPDLLPAKGKLKAQDGFQAAAKESTQAFYSYKKAVELKGKLELKVSIIEQQLEDVKKELLESIASFEAAEKAHLGAVAALAIEAKKEPEVGKDLGMQVDEEKKDGGPAAAVEGAEEPDQYKQYRATLDEAAKSKLDAHLEYLGATKRRKLETSEAKFHATLETARSMAQGLQALRTGFDFALLEGKGKGSGGPTRAEGKGNARHGPY